MRKLCPNYDYQDGLETVLEVPIPEEMFPSTNKNSTWESMKSWVKPNNGKLSSLSLFGARNAEIQLLLGVVGAPLTPFPLTSDNLPRNRNVKDHSVEASMAKYIMEQYIGAVGGEKVLETIESMYAMGKVTMVVSEFYAAGDGGGVVNNKMAKVKSLKSGGEMGGFVLWQKRPELWCLELVVAGCKISAGSDGKVAWRQTPWHHSHASRGPPRPLRRLLQGLDPRLTAILFRNSICIGEKTIQNEDCFVLKLDAEHSSLKTRSSSNVEIIKHTVLGYFSQKTGLLIQLEDSHLLRIKTAGSNQSVFWETKMESFIDDYRDVDGIKIAHKGKNQVALFRFEEESERHSRTRMEEVWTIEEVDFNIKGLTMDCFLPPSDLKKEEESSVVGEEGCDIVNSHNEKFQFHMRANTSRVGASKVVAIDANVLEGR